MGTFWLKGFAVLILGIMGTDSGGDPYASQPRLVVESGNLSIRGGLNRNVSISTKGQSNVLVNNVPVNSVEVSQNGRASTEDSLLFLNLRMNLIDKQMRRFSVLPDRMIQLEENMTDISARMSTFLGTDQNRITNRGMRRYFAKIKQLEDKVNHLTELLSTNECSSNPCRHGGTCVDSYNGYVCNCPSGWEGPTCENDVNECAWYSGTAFGCQHGATCTNLPGSYRCDCPANWYGIHCTEQLDDCNSASHQELCGHGTCVNENRVQPGQPKYRCICDAGWTKAPGGITCTQDIDECGGPEPKCSVNPRVLCINLPGTFYCGSCPAGYTGNGLYCEDINECETQNGGCSMNPYVECLNTPGSRRCGPCPPGYFGNGEQCMFQSVCSNNRGGCHPLATCIDNPAITATYRECRCPPGFVGNGEGLTGCVQQTQGITCANNPCQHGTCQMVGNSYHCTCEAGYYGTNCENRQDVCARNPCQNGGTCVSGVGTFTCACPNRFSGPTCTEQARACGGYLRGNDGTLQYPEFSLHYEHGENCAWVITVEEGKVINVTFDHFHLEGGRNCEYDFLQLNDGPTAGSRVIGRFCSDQLHGVTFPSTHNQVYLWFQSDRTVTAAGFTITWKAVDPVCGGVYNVSDYGSVRSPGYPGVYPVNRTCSWLVQVPMGKRIQFSFATLMLEHHQNCSYDYLKVIDGASDRDPVIGTYCTTETPPPLITSGHAAMLLFHSDHSVQDSGFNIAYSSLPGIQGCGGTFTAAKGTVTSPNYPDVYDNNMQCEWLVRIHPDNRIKVTFVSFNLERHRECQFDSLEIFDGPSDASTLLGRYCGDSLPIDTISNTNQIYIRFKTDTSKRMPGFKLQYSTVCGGIYTDLSGVLTSPFYPDSYPAEANCLYELRMPQGYIVNLTIDDIEIEQHVNCLWDHLEVRDGDSETSRLMATICGTATGKNFLSTFNRMLLKFVTDGSVQNKGFTAEYTALEIGCGGIQTEDNGQISSPRHPESYPHSVLCRWLIRAPEGYIIRLSFSAFHLEGSTNCSYDYVLVEDVDGNQIGRFCGARKPPVLTTLDSTVIVKFVTDESIARDGFVANYQFFDASQTCGGDLYQTSGILKSPGYPDHYPHAANCAWVLNAPNSQQITLNITDFNIEFHENCKYDYLEIRNGGYSTSPLIGKFCGTQIMPIIRSHSNQLRLLFKTDDSMSAPGFQISFDTSVTGCGGTLTAASGSIISPNFPQAYPLNADCQWLIRVSEGSVIALSVVEIDIEQHETCLYDYLQIFDGGSENSKSLVRICNNQQNPGHIVSTGNTVLVRFRSDFSEEAGGFHLVYHTQCNTVLTKRRGVIESPNFPNSYPHNHNCSWTIQAPMGSNISLSFSHIFIEGDENCTMDYVEVIELSRSQGVPVSLGKFCGDMSRPPNTMITGANTAIVRLITDRSVSREGFRLEYSFVGCGGDIMNKPQGEITSPNYPGGYPLETECFWHIWYPPGSSVEFTVLDLDIENANECIYDFLKVYAGEDEQSPQILNACHSSSNSTVVTSHGNQILVHFHSDVTVAHRGFRAKFRAVKSGCGGRFTAEEATIMSSHFPDPYNESDECEWLIEVSPSNRVILEFYDFELPAAVNCSHGYVAIYDGGNTSSPLIIKHCGAKPEGPIYATTNQMLVQLVADGHNIAKGFRAHYTSGCGRRLVADNGGEITSPHYPNWLQYPVNCSWIIYSSQIGEKVSLTTTFMSVHERENCSYASLTVYDGDMEDSPVIGQYCGNRVPPVIVSRGSTLRVFLKNLGIFRAVYGLLSQHCGGSFKSPAGSFSSPGFPTNYDMEMECVWIIEASAGSKVHISFQSFSLEGSDYCTSDYVEIHENDPSGRLIGKYCGNSIPSNVTAAHKLWIKFRSDDIGTAPGFMAHYEIEHGTVLNGTSGDIASPGYPNKFPHNDDYEWTVIVPEGMYVSIYFREIGIVSYNEPGACSSYVKIIDGFDEEAPVLGQFCGFQVPDPVFSTGNVVTVQFHVDYLPAVFYLHWAAVNESGARTDGGDSCLEEHILNSTSLATIQSPEFPQYYPHEYSCTYVLRTLPTHHIDLAFETFEFEGASPACNYDKLVSYVAPNPNVDLWNLNSTLCGEYQDLLLTSPNNVMKLEMYTDRWINLRGFKATAKSKCGGQLFGNNGVLRSSSIYPNIMNLSRFETFRCEWVITVKERRTIQLTFDNFDIVSDAVCSNSYIMLKNGGLPTSPMLGNGRYCGSTIPVLPESSSNQVYVQLSYTPTAGSSPMFDLRYTVKTMGCGGHLYLNLDNPYVEITSPNYPSPPTHDAECEWIIVSPSGSRMRVDFDSDFHMSPHCYGSDNVEYLQIHDGGTENAEVLKRYCGSDTPSSTQSTDNALYMKFVSGTDDRGSGFKATVRMAHCGGTISSVHSIIRSPDFPQNYGSSIECEWFLKMRYGYHIVLTLTEFETPAASNCSLTDYLEIRNIDKEGNVLRTYCGHLRNLPFRIDVPGPSAYVKFKSDSSNTGKGFSLAMNAQVDEGCGGTKEGPSGVITSPRYPSALPAPRDCFWRIYAPAGRKIKVTFNEINLPYDEIIGECSSYVAIYNVTHRSLFRNRDYQYRFCGTTLPGEIDSTTSGLYIVFTTHGLNAGQGFSLTYSTQEAAGCGGVLPRPSGILESPFFPVQNGTFIECLWTMNLGANQTLALKFDYLDLPGSVANFCRPSVLFAYTGR